MQTPQNILMVLNAFFPEKTGRTNKMMEIAQYWLSRGSSVLVLSKSDTNGGIANRDGIVVLSVCHKPNPVLRYIDNNYFSQLLTFPLNAALKSIKTLKPRDIDIIYSPNNPWFNHMLAFYLKVFICKNSRWVVEFRDPIVDHPHLGKGLFRRLNARLIERIITMFADKIIIPKGHALTPEIFLKRHPRARTKTTEAPYFGANFKLYDGLHAKTYKDIYRISYTGTILPTKGYQENFSTFLDGLRKFCRTQASMGMRIVFTYAGQLPPGLKVENIDPENNFTFEYAGFLDQEEVAQLQKSSDLLLIIQESSSLYADYIISKFWDYAAAGRPMMAIAAKSSRLSQFIRLAGLGVIAENSAEVADQLTHILENKIEAKGFNPDLRLLKKYSRENYLKSLAKALTF